jgi:hypothetical protein
MKTAAPDRAKKKELLDTLLDELGVECRRTLDLLTKLHIKRNGKSHRTDILAELSASILHLHLHTKGLPDLIDEVFEREDDD